MTRPPLRAAAAALAALLAALLLPACAREESSFSPSAAPESLAVPAAPAPRGDPAFAVLSLHANGFTADTPSDAAAALATAVRAADPAVVILQGMGAGDALDAFQKALADSGLTPFPHASLFKVGTGNSHLAYLSRVPVAADDSRDADSYSIGPERLTVLHGFLDITVEPPSGAPLRILAADLKDKEFHPLAQAEMRRSEARLLANHVRAILRADPSARLLVAGAFHDGPSSAAARTVLAASPDAPLADLRPLDANSHAWTCLADDDSCERSDYLLASPALLPSVDPSRTFLIDAPFLSSATPHRPLLLTLSP